VRQERTAGKSPEEDRRDDPAFVPRKGNGDDRRGFAAETYPQVPKHCFEAQRCICDRAYQREGCIANPEADTVKRVNHAAVFLKPGIVWEHSWFGRGSNREIHIRASDL
jgi:hypothetical protein